MANLKTREEMEAQQSYIKENMAMKKPIISSIKQKVELTVDQIRSREEFIFNYCTEVQEYTSCDFKKRI